MRKDSKKTLVVTKLPDLPIKGVLTPQINFQGYLLEPNRSWVGILVTTKELMDKAGGNLVFLEIAHSARKKPYLIKIDFSDQAKLILPYPKV